MIYCGLKMELGRQIHESRGRWRRISNVTKCYRCRKRNPNFERWYADYMNGLALGTICPTCRTADEDMEAQINEAMGSSAAMETGVPGPFEAMQIAIRRGQFDEDERSAAEQLAGMLASSYRTPEALRSEAKKLASLTEAYVSLMRRTADEMEVSDRRWHTGNHRS